MSSAWKIVGMTMTCNRCYVIIIYDVKLKSYRKERERGVCVWGWGGWGGGGGAELWNTD